MSLEFFAHPFSSYCQKVLIALWADETPFEYRLLEAGPSGEFRGAQTALAVRQVPAAARRRQAGHRDHAASSSISRPITRAPTAGFRTASSAGASASSTASSTSHHEQHAGRSVDQCASARRQRGPLGAGRARERLHVAYDWLEANLPGDAWAVGETFTLADCAAAPSLFYADWVEEIGDKRPKLTAYRARLLAHPVVARAVDEGRPYRHYFPLGAPDRD